MSVHANKMGVPQVMKIKVIPSSLNVGTYLLTITIQAPEQQVERLDKTRTPNFYNFQIDSMSAKDLGKVKIVLADTIPRIPEQDFIAIEANLPKTPISEINFDALTGTLNTLRPSALATYQEDAPQTLELRRNIIFTTSKKDQTSNVVTIDPTQSLFELIDSLADSLSDLKLKTLANLSIEIIDIESPDKPQFVVETNEILRSFSSLDGYARAELGDLCSNEIRTYSFTIQTAHKNASPLKEISLKFEYEDLLLARKVKCGQRIEVN